MPAAQHDRRPRAYDGKSGPDSGCAALPARSSDLVRLPRKSCHNGRRWACLGSMLASDSPMVRVSKPKPIGAARSPPMESTTPNSHGLFVEFAFDKLADGLD